MGTVLPTVPRGTAPQSALPFLTGGGAMGALIAALDWSATPLGPPAGWSPSLQTTLSLCLASPFPLCFSWGPHRIQFYNDGYREIVGAKHPVAMGQDFRTCWMSAWPVIGVGFERCLELGETTFHSNTRMFLDRSGYLEETFFTSSFSPIRDESGAVTGVFHPVNETTQLVLSERRLRILRDLNARTSDVKSIDESLQQIGHVLSENSLDVPFCLLYRIDSTGRQATLAAQGGVPQQHAVAVAQLSTAAATERSWPLGQVLATDQAVELADLRARFGEVICEPYPEPVQAAVAFRINCPGAAQPVALLVVGVSPRRPLDTPYRGFCDMLATAVTTAVSNAHAYEQERRRSEALAELDRAKTTFFSNISHEFRTPLALMLGPVKDALADITQPLLPAQQQRLELIQRNALRLQKLVNALLDFSRIEAGRMQARYEATDLSALTADLASNFRSACEQAGLTLQVQCPPLPERVYVDHDLWEKIVLNLLSNAFKFTLRGTILVNLRATASHAELRIRDTGAGIAADQLPKLFERFQRVEGAQGRTMEGSGIGLALVRELVLLHGGQVTVTSQPGHGSEFLVRIPLGKAHLPAEHLCQSAAPTGSHPHAIPYVQEALSWIPRPLPALVAPDLAADGRSPHSLPLAATLRPRILLADDNADMRDYVGRLLAEPFAVQAVANGAAALDAVRAALPDLIVSDVMMPELDGFGLLAALRRDPRTANLPVILLSARAGEEARIEGLAAGATDYLLKPFSASELLARVTSLLQQERLRKAAAEAALRENEARLRRMADTMPQIVWTNGPDGIPTYLNRRWYEYTGLSADSLCKPANVIHPNDQQRAQQAWHMAMQTGSSFTSELRMRSRTGEYRWFLSRCLPITNSDGTVLEWFGTSTDIHDRKLAETEILQLNASLEERVRQRTAELQAANNELESFSYSVSHDLRAPLRAIDGFSRIVIDEFGPHLPVLAREYLQDVRQNTQHMGRLVDDLLAFSRLGRQPLNKLTVDQQRLVSECCDELRASGAVKEATIRVGDLPSALADRALLKQVWLNLLGNALKYSGKAAQPLIEIGTESGPRGTTYFVRDNGVGFDMRYVHKLFGVFQRLHRAEDYEGTGVGLAIVQRIVHRHGGLVWATAQPNQGATFYFTLATAQGGAG